jgi:hypothetical protein
MAIFNSPQSPISMNNKQQTLVVLLLITISIDLATTLAQQPINFPQSPISMNKQQITLTTLLLIITKIMLRTPLAQHLINLPQSPTTMNNNKQRLIVPLIITRIMLQTPLAQHNAITIAHRRLVPLQACSLCKQACLSLKHLIIKANEGLRIGVIWCLRVSLFDSVRCLL